MALAAGHNACSSLRRICRPLLLSLGRIHDRPRAAKARAGSRMATKELLGFVAAVRPFIKASEKDVKRVRAYAKQQGRSIDWPWNRFVHAFATNGGVRHYENNIEEFVSTTYGWAAIARAKPAERKRRLKEATNPRWRYRNQFEKVFQRFKKAGGPSAIKKEYYALRTPQERIAFWKGFEGIGDKYAREIPMRSYDPMFVTHFAVDARLRTFLAILFGKVPNYNASEEFFRAAAKELGVSCWALDTILFNNDKAISRDLRRRKSGRA